MNRRFELTDQEWERLAPLLPSTRPRRGGRWRDHRRYLSEASMAVLTKTTTQVAPAELLPA